MSKINKSVRNVFSISINKGMSMGLRVKFPPTCVHLKIVLQAGAQPQFPWSGAGAGGMT